MPANKNQHFVPRCHLKPFTLDGQGLAINLYNIGRKQLIECAPVKNQCSRDYFYGKDSDLEKSIQSLESEYANVVRRLRENPGRTQPKDAEFLSSFWTFQHLRTEAIQQSILKNSIDLQQAIGEDVPDLVLDKKEATLIALSAFASHSDVISDLRMVLVRNRSPTPFLTSDNPAVQTNRWALSNSKRGVATFGLISAGEIALLPLTEDLLVLMYDQDIYSIPHVDGVVSVRNSADIKALNDHQILNCAANLYVGPSFSAANVAELPDLATQRELSGPRVHVFQKRSDTDHQYFATKEFDRSKGTEAIFATPTYYAMPTRWPDFLRWRSNGFYFSNGSGVGPIRRSGIRAERSHTPFRKLYTGR